MRHLFPVLVLPALLAGCAATHPPEVTPSADPSDLTSGFRKDRYISPMAGYHARTPADPRPWRKLNDDASSQGGDAS